MTQSLPLWPLLLACAVLTAATWAATWGMRELLLRYRILDLPNERSSHDVAKPRGGGLALVPMLLLAWLLWRPWLTGVPPGFNIAILGAIWLIAVSWLDDLRDLAVGWRLAAQAAAVAAGLAMMGEAGLVFQGLLPPLLDRLAAGLLWLWFVNLFNFMDGIDGISAVQTIAIGLGLGLAAWAARLDVSLVVLGWLAAAAALGFLPWNWAPAKLFLGDVGSIPLGYLLGWLLLIMAAEGQWAVALILPAYYLADATLTLLRRALARRTLWQAHREHFYQQPLETGRPHEQVTRLIAVGNLVLLGLALLATQGYPWVAIGVACVLVGALLTVLQRWGRG